MYTNPLQRCFREQIHVSTRKKKTLLVTVVTPHGALVYVQLYMYN